ncbi:flagellar basal body P-ring formation chaperone FlgA [Colwellia psychrerythraea]|uniref:Flagella basal body P-ring formation protein FlgA n=1 Tax=Colwellia psychrerythraea TaxID=28229 RepID=A0A099KKS7_COLPS|nr:flagellar basal body P-ring formation chaperone FlgA [Colwellia psychrerythraea]KGJ91409.1 flagella basal body P-ring formation protein FlgA [Colwellia psychrerythraea]
MRLTKIIFTFIFLLLIKQTTIFATELDSAFIERFAKNYLIEQFPSTEDEKVLISVAHLDPRITIKPCKIPLTANIPEKNRAINVNVKISCDESIQQWKIYLSAKVEITKAVLIAKNTISKGDELDESNVELAFIPINKIRGNKLTDTKVVFGAKAKKRIAKGRAISKRSICLICKGDAVTIIASSDNFSIKTQGVALSSGNINEQIRVKNTRSKKVITPRIKGINQVIINL